SIVATRPPSLISATAICSAVVDLPEPPFSLPITSTCARPGTRAACDWTMLGLIAGWKVLVIFRRPERSRGTFLLHNAIDCCGKEVPRLRRSPSGFARDGGLDLPDPDRGVVEHRAAVGPARFGRGDGVDADAGLEVAVGPDALDDH